MTMFAAIFLLTIPARVFVNGQIAQTSAVCTSEFAWMGNTRGVSPCQVASSLNALCNNGNWNIPQLNGSIHYTNPDSSGTASLCTCSWASYNLISACVACQGYSEWISFWSDYTSQCTGKLSDSYWPASITISTNILIPYWASTDPTQWTSQKFNPSEAKQIQQSGHADLASGSPATSNKISAPVGAIVGGVVGGLVTLTVFIALAICILRRYRSSTTLFSDGTGSRTAHIRKISETTDISGITSAGSALTSVLPGMFRNHNTNAVGHLHNGRISVSSLPFFSSGSAGEQLSPPQQNGGHPRTEGVVTPFTLPPTNEPLDKKQSNGEWPASNSTNAASHNLIRMEVIPSLNATRRERYNPPTYSESLSGTTVPSLHRVQDSMDSSTYSVPETAVHVDTSTRGTRTPVNRVSSMGQTMISSPLNTSFGTNSSSQDLGISTSERSWNPRRQESFHASDIA